MRNFAQDFLRESKFQAYCDNKLQIDKGWICVHQGHSTLQESD